MRVPVKRITKTVLLVHSDVYGPFPKPTFGDSQLEILFVDNDTRYTSLWLLPNNTAQTFTCADQSFQARVDSMGYGIKTFWCNHGPGEYDNKTFCYVLRASSTTYEPCPACT